jgi:methyl-accepting chemotaxis protein
MKKIRTIRFRLIACFVFFSSLAAFVGLLQFNAIRDLSKTASFIAENVVVGLTNTSKMNSSARSLLMHLKLLNSGNMDPSKIEESSLYIAEARDDFQKYLAMAQTGQLSEKEQRLMAEISDQYEAQKSHLDALINASSSQPSTFYKDIKQADLFHSSDEVQKMIDKLSALAQLQNDEGYNWSVTAQVTSKKSIYTVLIGICSMIFIGLFAGYRLAQGINKDLSDRLAVTKKTIETFDLNADQISASSQQLYERVRREADSVQSSASAIFEINSMIEKVQQDVELVARNANECLQQSKQAQKTNEAMRQSVSALGDTAQSLCQQLNQSSNEIPDLIRDVTNIESKTKVIDEIVFQTRLLSFNASIEASRAGEAGKGFMVVANEVGALAKLSGQAAVEINQTLQSSMTKFKNMEANMMTAASQLQKQADSSIRTSQQNAKASDESLATIAASIETLQNRISSIVKAMAEQVIGSKSIQTALAELETVTATNKEAAAASHEIAQNLKVASNEAKGGLQTLEVVVLGQSVMAPRDQPIGEEHRSDTLKDLETPEAA